MKLRAELWVGLAILAVLAAPWLLRPKDRLSTKDAQDTLVIITPHSESIREEFSAAFAPYYKEKTGRTVRIDWRIPGGTSEIAMVLRSAYRSAFEYEWTKRRGKVWDSEAAGFWDAKSKSEARTAFLASDVGVGMDLFFGGGSYDFISQANAGALVSATPDGAHGLRVLAERHPEWFTDEVYPANLSGEALRDPEWRWAGACLSGFGIVSNLDVCRRLGLDQPPQSWADLTKPTLYKQIALADPTKSGSAAKAFEMIVQQAMRSEVNRAGGSQNPDVLAKGWDDGIRLIFKLSANGRYFTDSASKVPHDVAAGEAAAGMSIDFYGRTFNEVKRKADGSSRVVFEMPVGGTSMGADPIGLLRGAPNPAAADLFMEFVLSEHGQRIWAQRAGTAGGPEKTALRRIPIRRDVFLESRAAGLLSDPEADAWEQSKGFTYEPEWTGKAFSSLRFIIRVACVETHHEQREAWEAIIRNGFPPQALAEFENVIGIGLAEANGEIAAVLKSKDRIQEVRMAREHAMRFRKQYQKARELAERKQ